MQLIRSQRPELSTPSNRLDSWFRDPFFGSRLWPSLFDWNTDWNHSGFGQGCATDLFEDGDAYYARIELPGVKKKDLNLELENAVLTVSYERHQDKSDGEKSTERFSQSLTVPDGTAVDNIRAKLKDGILTIEMPKMEDSKPRTIKVS